MASTQKKSDKLIKFFASPEIFFYSLIWLIFLTVIGTVSQKYIGLYLSQQKYFSSFFIWIGEAPWQLPLPGGYLTLGVVSIGLVAKLFFKSRWTKNQLGINITHIGAFLLLFGGLLTALFSSEGAVVIPEGDSSNVVVDYHEVELAFVDSSPKEFDRVVAFQKGWLKQGEVLKDLSLPFSVEIISFCRNCKFNRRKVPQGPGYHGFAKMFQLKTISMNPEDEKNRAGITFRVKGAGDQDGIYSVFEYMPVPQTIVFSTKTGVEREFLLEIRHKQTHLPFSIELVDFEKKVHPGTGMASAYSSKVILVDGNVEQKKLIQMNEPLRYKGYTFYQSSFMQTETETTVLAAVKNVGRTFPYISSIIMCIGLLIHLLLQVPILIKKQEAK